MSFDNLNDVEIVALAKKYIFQSKGNQKKFAQTYSINPGNLSNYLNNKKGSPASKNAIIKELKRLGIPKSLTFSPQKYESKSESKSESESESESENETPVVSKHFPTCFPHKMVCHPNGEFAFCEYGCEKIISFVSDEFRKRLK